MNKVILVGRLTRDPESRMSQSNMEISRFSLACQGEFVSRTGEREVEFINCVAFNRNATTINKYCRKGQMILIQGRIRNSSYDAQDGSKRYTTDVVVDSFEFLSSGRGNEDISREPVMNSEAYSPSSADNVGLGNGADVSEDPYKDFGEEFTLSSDDLPF